MEWYCGLADCVFSDENNSSRPGSTLGMFKNLRVTVVNIYKDLLAFLMKSICSYYHHEGLALLKKAFRPEDWSDALQKIRNKENKVDSRLDQCVKQEHLTALRNIATRAGQATDLLGDVHKSIKAFIAEQNVRVATEADDRLRDSLRIIDPNDDMITIEKQKDRLFDGSFNWILDNPMFKEFTSDTYITNFDTGSGDDGSEISTPVPPRKDRKSLLSIKGDAGTGKTMLQIGIIRHLSALPVAFCPSIAYFFFQHGDQKVNSCIAALRSLIFMLLLQQPHLIRRMRDKYKTATPSYLDENDKARALTGLEDVF